MENEDDVRRNNNKSSTALLFVLFLLLFIVVVIVIIIIIITSLVGSNEYGTSSILIHVYTIYIFGMNYNLQCHKSVTLLQWRPFRLCRHFFHSVCIIYIEPSNESAKYLWDLFIMRSSFVSICPLM